MAVVEIRDLVMHFPVRGGVLNRVQAHVHAVNGVSFDVEKGSTLGIVGESGCGKSTIGKLMMRLIDPTSGTIRFDGTDITHLSHHDLMPFRRRMQMVFQDPYSSLNPRMTVQAALKEAMRFHEVVGASEVDAAIVELLRTVGLRPDDCHKFPHEFSGGQRQRIGIARALSLKPELIIADEPVSALDVSIQAQILNLLMDLKDEYGLTMVFISHDLKVVEHFCDRLVVMYLGHVVEEMPCTDLQSRSVHPYTKALLGANPINDPADRRPLEVLEGDVPSPFHPPPGCPFVTRCAKAIERCGTEMPPREQVSEVHSYRCWAP